MTTEPNAEYPYAVESVYLRTTRAQYSLPIRVLSKGVKLSIKQVEAIESGKIKPEREYILQFGKLINLHIDRIDWLLDNYNYPLLHNQKINPPIMVKVDPLQELTVQVQDSQDTVAAIEEKISNPIHNQDHSSQVLEELNYLKVTLTQMQTTSQKLTATVSIPPPEELDVKLVKSNELERLGEYQAEETIWFSISGVFLGAILGVFTNVATGGQFNPTTLLILAVFIICAGIFGWAAYNKHQQANKLKGRIFPNKDKSKTV